MFTIEQPKGRPHITSVRFGDNTFLEFFYPDETPAHPRDADHHFALITDNIFEMEKVLQENEIEIISSPRIVRDGNWQLWCRDPNGYRVEIMQLVPDCPQLQKNIIYQTLY